MCVSLLSFVERLLVIESNIAGKLWKAFSKLSKMNGSSFLYVGSFKSYTLYIQSCLDSFASIKRAAFAHSPQLYSYAEKKVVPERFLKNTSNYFFLFKESYLIRFFWWYSSLFHTILEIIFLNKGFFLLYYSAALFMVTWLSSCLSSLLEARNPPS